MYVEKITLGAGCFWGVEEKFRKIKGVLKTTVGFSGGKFKNPTYKDVCSGKTGHAEVVQLEYNPEVISFTQLLDIFWKIHNPTTLNRQGYDIGNQYRSVIYYYNIDQKKEAIKSKKKLGDLNIYNNPIVTEISPICSFYPAEEYHQKYLEKRNSILGICKNQ